MAESVRFDRAAEFYDQTRATDAEAMARTVELLRRELGRHGPVLEVGVGTGLVALPLHEAGIELAGLDISAPMLGKLVEKAGGRVPFPLVLGDATRMPFPEDAFGAAYLRWVLHLIPDWLIALAEVARTVRSGGVFLADLGSYGGEWAEIRERFAAIVGLSLDPVGLRWADFESLDAAMTQLGAAPRELESVREGGEESLGEFIAQIGENRFSWTWSLPEDVRMRAIDELGPWARERFGDLEEPRRYEHATRWRAYDLA